jgi:5-methylthioribose kinase
MDNHITLSAETAIEYVKRKTNIFSKSEILTAKVFDGNRQSVDGLCNHLVLVKSMTTGHSVVLKQMMPYVRALKDRGIVLPMKLARINTEVYYAKLLDEIMPGAVPTIHLWDEANSIVIMEDLSEMKILRNEMINMKQFPDFPRQLGEFLGRSAFFTSERFLSKNEKMSLAHIFEFNNDGCIFENLIFEAPFKNYKDREIYHALQKDIDDICNNPNVLKEVAILKDIFMNKKQALIHADLHTSNIFVDEKKMKVFDGEYAHYGPVAYDIGLLIGSFITNYASLIGVKCISEEKRQDYQAYVFNVISEMYNTFERSFIELCQKHHKDQNLKAYMDSTIKDSIGFAACSSFSRVYDYNLTFDFKRTDNLEEQVKGRRFIIKLTKYLLLNRSNFNSIEDVLSAMKALTLTTVVYDLVSEAFENRQAM